MRQQELEKLVLEQGERIRQLEKQIKFPLDIKLQKTIEQTFFDTLKALVFKGGLPVYTSERTDTPKDKEIYAKDIGGTRELCIYISGTEYCVEVT